MLKNFISILFLFSIFCISAAAQDIEVDRYNINARIDTAASAVDVRASIILLNSQTSRQNFRLTLTKLAKVSAAAVNGSPAKFETVEDRRVTTLNQIVITPQASIDAAPP